MKRIDTTLKFLSEDDWKHSKLPLYVAFMTKKENCAGILRNGIRRAKHLRFVYFSATSNIASGGAVYCNVLRSIVKGGLRWLQTSDGRFVTSGDKDGKIPRKFLVATS